MFQFRIGLVFIFLILKMTGVSVGAGFSSGSSESSEDFSNNSKTVQNSFNPGGGSLAEQEPQTESDEEPPVDLTFLEEGEANPNSLKIQIAHKIYLNVELFTDLTKDELTPNSVTIFDFLKELSGTTPKRLHDVAMQLYKKICETTYAWVVHPVLGSLRDTSNQFFEIIEREFKRDYVVVYQAYMYLAELHKDTIEKFSEYVNKAYSLVDAHNDLERKNIITKYICYLDSASNFSGRIERALKRQAKINHDFRLVENLKALYESLLPPPPSYFSSVTYPLLGNMVGFPPPYFIALDAPVTEDESNLPPSYEKAKQALGIE